MGSPREERLARNEALFRTANERMAAWEERHEGDATERYFCECVDTECRAQVALCAEDYEAVRSNSRWFLVVAGHEDLEIDTVIREREGWVLVEKPSSVAGVVRGTDPRRDEVTAP